MWTCPLLSPMTLVQCASSILVHRLQSPELVAVQTNVDISKLSATSKMSPRSQVQCTHCLAMSISGYAFMIM